MMRTTQPAIRKRNDEIDQRNQRHIGPARQFDPLRRAIRRHPRETPAISRPSSRSSASLAALADDAACEHHQDAVGQRADFIELDRDQQYRLAHVAQFDETAVNEFDGADIDAAGRLADDQQIWDRARSRAPE